MSPAPLWRPSAERTSRATITRFAAHVGRREAYDTLWQWSVDDLDGFWSAVWEFFDVQADGDPSTVLETREMPGARWFPGVQLNYAEHFFRDKPDDRLAIQHASECRPLASWTWGDLRVETARIRAGLQARGVGRGDCVAAYLPNIPETIAAFLATASLGAIWSSAAPEFGARSVIDRFTQIKPKVVLAVDGYRYGGRDFDCSAKVALIATEVGSEVVRFGYLDGTGWQDGFLQDAALEFARVPFDHPLWVLYSSGTTGVPKAIVHGHGGILLEQLKATHLHLDAHDEDRVFWFTTTGWMMWNYLVGVLLSDASIVLYDGNPAGEALWDLAADTAMTLFGTSAGYIEACMKDGIEPNKERELNLSAVGVTGSPLSPEGFDWIYAKVGGDTWLFSTSGGTDVCTAFVGGVPTLPVYRGELQARLLGCAVQAWNEKGEQLIGEVGELVVVAPMPSMPVSFWGDEGGSRYRESYFDMYPGVWRHGDWIQITERATAILYGRSDATINRGGVRMGTAEIYRAVLAIEEVIDALVVDVDGWMPLFVRLREGLKLDDELTARIARRIREDCSPRHVPSEIIQVAEVPRTLSGKILEIPVKRILTGADPEKAANRESLANPQALEVFVRLAETRAARPTD
jgi:acetoacetyl-CoA synthetase